MSFRIIVNCMLGSCVDMFVCMDMYVCLCLHVCVCLCGFVCIYLCVCLCVCLYGFVCVYFCVCICICVFLSVLTFRLGTSLDLLDNGQYRWLQQLVFPGQYDHHTVTSEGTSLLGKVTCTTHQLQNVPVMQINFIEIRKQINLCGVNNKW